VPPVLEPLEPLEPPFGSAMIPFGASEQALAAAVIAIRLERTAVLRKRLGKGCIRDNSDFFSRSRQRRVSVRAPRRERIARTKKITVQAEGAWSRRDEQRLSARSVGERREVGALGALDGASEGGARACSSSEQASELGFGEFGLGT
jgi:hypothetical protein